MKNLMTEPHILIAEDEAAIRKLLATILERYDFTVTTATDGADVLRQLAAGAKPDVLLLDLMMPNVSGFGVIAELQSQKHPLAERIIVLTAASDREVNELPPSTRVIRKPFEVKRLIAALRELSSSPDSAHGGTETPAVTLLPDAIAEA
jgi:CheY-like chemotaxis protein